MASPLHLRCHYKPPKEDPRGMALVTGQKQPLAAPGVSARLPVYRGAVAVPKMTVVISRTEFYSSLLPGPSLQKRHPLAAAGCPQ